MARRPRTKPVIFTLRNGHQVVVDTKDTGLRTDEAGQVLYFRPARHQKPEQGPLLQRILNTFRAVNKTPDPDQTTEEGAAASAAPTVARMQLYAQRYERRQKIMD